MPSTSLLLGVGTVLSALSTPALAAVYEAQDTYQGDSFLKGWDFLVTDQDPTHGFVEYVSKDEASAKQLIKQVGNAQYIGVDHQTPLTVAGGKGRKSVRIETNTNYNQGLFVVDISHMPGGICGTWPAFWSLGSGEWPKNGEIDIIEGVNTNNVNKMVLHTDTQCSVDGKDQTDPQNLYNCALDSASGTSGCDVNSRETKSYGADFNANGGGVYAMEWTDEAIKMWFFPRGSIPATLNTANPDTSKFGVAPNANFKGNCDIAKKFINQRFIFDTTFCGDWAGNVYAQSGCPMYSGLSGYDSCMKYVAEHPSAFENAYWLINSFKTYKKNTGSTSSSSSVSSSASSTAASSTAASSTVVSSSVASSSAASSTVASSSDVSSSVASSSTGYPAGETTTPCSSDLTASSSGYPAGETSTSSYPAGETTTPCSTDVTPSSTGYPAGETSTSEYPAGETSTPCESSTSGYPAGETSTSKYPTGETSTSKYPAGETSTSKYPAGETSTPCESSTSGYPAGETSTSVYPAGETSTPCESDVVPSSTGYPAGETSTSVYPAGETSTPCESDVVPSSTGYPAVKTSTSEYPAGETSTPCESSTPAYPVKPSSSPVYPVYPEETPSGASSSPVYPVYPTSAPTKPSEHSTTVTTTYTTTYVDVCPTGYTTITTTHTVTYCPDATPTPSSGYPVAPPPGFTVTEKYCEHGCGSYPTTVTVTIPCTACGTKPTPPASYEIYTPKPSAPGHAHVHKSFPPGPYETPATLSTKPIIPIVPKPSSYTPSHPGSSYPVNNGTVPHSTGGYPQSTGAVPTKTGGYPVVPEFTGAASSIKSGVVAVVGVAFAAMML